MIILGLILLVIGLLVAKLVTIGIVLLVIGLVLAILGHAVAAAHHGWRTLVTCTADGQARQWIALSISGLEHF
jgi:hypothetical protein